MSYPRSCDDVIKDLHQRRNQNIMDNINVLEISKEAKLYRLIRKIDIDENTKQPKSGTFSNHGLSVLVKDSQFPEFDIEEEVHKRNSQIDDERKKIVGYALLNAKDMIDMGFALHHDPFPGPKGVEQHKNHAQIVCDKTKKSVQRQIRTSSKYTLLSTTQDSLPP